MADNLKGIPFSSPDEGQSYPDVAKALVYERAVQLGALDEYPDLTVYVVWFAYTLGSWKALCSTNAPDGRYYEVIYSKERDVAFVDTYVKVDNVAVPLPSGTPR